MPFRTGEFPDLQHLQTSSDALTSAFTVQCPHKHNAPGKRKRARDAEMLRRGSSSNVHIYLYVYVYTVYTYSIVLLYHICSCI